MSWASVLTLQAPYKNYQPSLNNQNRRQPHVLRSRPSTCSFGFLPAGEVFGLWSMVILVWSAFDYLLRSPEGFYFVGTVYALFALGS